MAEFTGERVIPGQVDPDLWNEHIARYAFAKRHAAGRRVLDAGCGTGYGAALLAETATSVTGVDIAAEAVRYALTAFGASGSRFVQASCEALPFPDGCFDLVVAFEVIEHTKDWAGFLREARRVLAADGECVISTPNLAYYAETRKQAGPNPYHVREFDAESFSAALREVFPFVSIFTENHIEGIGIQPLSGAAAFDLAIAETRPDPSESHFLLAVCSLRPRPPEAAYVYVPRMANILRERELHIERLEGELATKNAWLEELQREKQNLIEMFRSQTAELENSNRWAAELDDQLRGARERIVALQQELADHQERARQAVAGYENKIRDLEEESRKQAQWALETERRLSGELETKCAELERTCQELAECVRLLDTAEATVVERTEWAQRLDARVRELEVVLAAARASRWLRLGRRLGLGPALGQR